MRSLRLRSSLLSLARYTKRQDHSLNLMKAGMEVNDPLVWSESDVHNRWNELRKYYETAKAEGDCDILDIEQDQTDTKARTALAQILAKREQEVMVSACMYARQYYSIMLQQKKSGGTFYRWHTHTVVTEFKTVINSRFSWSIEEINNSDFKSSHRSSTTDWTVHLQHFTNEFDSTETIFEKDGISMELTKIEKHKKRVHMEYLVKVKARPSALWLSVLYVQVDMMLDEGMRLRNTDGIAGAIKAALHAFEEIEKAECDMTMLTASDPNCHDSTQFPGN